MAGRLNPILGRAAKNTFAAVPWIGAMYLFYWLDKSGTWTTETPHRGKMSVLLLASGMVLSLVLRSWPSDRDRQ